MIILDVYVRDILNKKNRSDFFEGEIIDSLEELDSSGKLNEVGIEGKFVKADSSKPYLFTRDILSCFVVLLECKNCSWMLHFNKLSKNMYNYIENFHLREELNIKNVYVFPGMMSRIDDLYKLLDLFNKYDNVLHFPYFDSSYGNSLVVGGLLYKYDKSNPLFFGINRNGDICSYDVNSLCVSDISSFFEDEVYLIKK